VCDDLLHTATVHRCENAVGDARETSYAVARGNADTTGVRIATDPDVTAAEQAQRSRLAQLSPREHEILALLSEGLTGRAIARRLFLSPETVRTHVRNATTKLGAKTRVQAVAMLVRERSVAPAAA
jgi:DNA-binding CsgD family transcriptional regulator